MTSPITPSGTSTAEPTGIPAPASPVTPGAESADLPNATARPARRERDPFFDNAKDTQALGATSTNAKSRSAYFDNAKFMAIVLVVVGHSIADLRDVRFAHALYLFVYTFHMPVFIVITGYFSRNFTFGGGKARKLITNIGVPYVIFETAYSVYHWAVGHSSLEISLLDPYFLTWFLMALFLWRLSTPVWQQIRWPVAVAVVISLLAGMSTLPHELEMHRVLGLSPFYVLGLVLKPRHFELLKRPRARVLGGLTVVAGFGFTVLVADRHMATEWVYWRSGNSVMHVGDLTGSVMRLALLAAATVMVAAFLTLVPGRRTWFTGLGGATLYAYLLHGFVTKLMEYMGWFDASFLHTVPGVLGTVVVAGALATLLCTPPVRRVMRWALEPDMSWAFVPLRRPGRA